eukprot:GHVU01166345.1.p2 GENE.GHVU01166345.1~~GHVU01166345.1.p2  ORF type:complete len:179 (-),score=22.45 GHVU01166345.1:77-613(-)
MEDNDLVSRTGTFRHVKCTRAGDFTNNMCTNCRSISSLPCFKKRMITRSESCSTETRSSSLNFKNMNHTELVAKLRETRKELNEKDSQLFFWRAQICRLKTRIRTTAEKLKEFSKRGNMKAITSKLQQAAEIGLLDDKKVFMDFLSSISDNLHLKKNGQRYKIAMKQFLEVVLIWGGP